MPVAGGPNTLGESNLVFAIDTHDTSNGITPLGCGGFNGSTQGVKNLLTGTVYPFANGMKLSGRTYYTAFAIDYPESSYGGDGAGRQGITPGYDVRSGGKLYDASRALHLWVFNNDTNSWIDNGATTYFRGARLAGHCYDNYSGAETGYLYEIGLFISDYNTLKSTFPNCTFIVAGSHRADQYTAALRTILYDLGMPTGYIDSDYIAAPEWILIGKPGLGTGNAFGWVYENYTTNAAQVAHINFGLPIKARGGMEFDGTNDTISLASNIQSGFTQASYEFICTPTSLPSLGDYKQLYIQENSTWMALYNVGGIPFFGIDLNNGSGWFDGNGGHTTGARTTATITANTTYHVLYSWNGSTVSIYLNGILQSTTSTLQASNGRQNVTTLGAGTTPRNIGSRGSGNFWAGNMDVVKFYNRALTASEVKQNYQQYKTRFNLS
jgi:hypothetical protein